MKKKDEVDAARISDLNPLESMRSKQHFVTETAYDNNYRPSFHRSFRKNLNTVHHDRAIDLEDNGEG